MYIPRKVFSVGQWDTFRFLLEFEEVEIRGSSFAFFVCFDQGGVELPIRESWERGGLTSFVCR